MGVIGRYTHWLHTRWPAGGVEKLPEVNTDGSTTLPGVYIVGDLTGIPLLKFASDTGARAVRTIVGANDFVTGGDGAADGVLDLAIIGGGVSGMAAALEARKHDLAFTVLEASEPFSTIVNFPKGKPIYTYPTEMTPAGEMQFAAEVKEPLLAELREQTLAQGIEPREARVERIDRQNGLLHLTLAGEAQPLQARRVIVAIGKSGNHRRLDVPGEDLDKVYNRLYDPADFCEQRVLVVGGGDSALETAIAIAAVGGEVTLSYRREAFLRPKAENLEKLDSLLKEPDTAEAIDQPVSDRVTTAVGDWLEAEARPGTITLALGTEVKEIGEASVVLTDSEGHERSLRNDIVFTMLGREPPLDFFRRSGIRVANDWTRRFWLTLALVLIPFTALYLWKGYDWGPYWIQNVWGWLGGTVAARAADATTFIGTVNVSMTDPGFYYTLAYSALIVIFGIRRIRRRRTPYITWQTWTLMLVQVIPLFILPYLLFPWMGANGWFTSGGLGEWFGRTFLSNGPGTAPDQYWRAFGFILAWPLFVYNIFTAEPLMGWLVLGFIQTFVLIPAMIYLWGKGAYCGWICSCGAMAETLGDTHRHKMPHGPGWNRLNMAGQAILALAFLLLGWRLLGWIIPGDNIFARTFAPFAIDGGWKPAVDILLAGIIGFGLYFHFSGRVWCRFFCPLAALMHIYTRFSRFRIFAEKKKCISCNVCTSVCHQGIDVMSFANKGAPMNDPECVRCSACVQSCPTGVLSFGQIDRRSGEVIKRDRLGASPVRMRETSEDKD